MDISTSATYLTHSKKVEQLLGQLYSARTTGGKETYGNELMALFHRHPSFISKSFAVEGWSPTPKTPFEHFLASAVDNVEAIKTLCNGLCPLRLAQILSTPLGKLGGLPIHRACQNSSSEVVDFLLDKQKPEIMAMQDNFRQLPLTIAMANSKLSVATLTRVVELNPEAVATGITLSKAMMQDLPTEFLESLVKAWPSSKSRLSFRYCGAQPLNLTHIRILCKLFPKLKSLSFTTTAWELPAFAYLLKKLKTCQTILHIQYLTLPSLAGEQQQQQEQILSDFQSLLQANTTLTRLQGLVCEDGDSALVQAWLEAIDTGIRNNRVLEQFQFTTSAANICVTSRKEYAWQQSEGLPDTTTNQGQRLGLSLTIWSLYDDEESEKFASLLARIPTFSSFPAVELRFSSFAIAQGATTKDITNEVVALLNEGHALKYLLCARYEMDLAAVCGALRTNTSLISFEACYGSGQPPPKVPSDAISLCRSMLEEDNLTLRAFLPMGAASPKVEHLLDLNRLGRSTARKTTGDEGDKLVELLLNVWKDTGLQSPSGLHEIRAHSVVYGLLSEAPGSWCHTASEKKRKDPPS